MDKYEIVLQICAILFICFLIVLLYKFIVAILKKNRLNDFSINLKNEKYVNESFILKIIHKFSGLLEKMIIFNGIARTYDKYIYEDSRLKKGIDYIALKILLGFLIIVIYLFICILYKDLINTLSIIVCFIIGFLVPDFYCMFLKNNRQKIVNKNIIGAIIIMNNSFKANRNVEQSIVDVIERTQGPVKLEFKKALNDIKLGISINDSFKRMYERTRIKEILEISYILGVANKSGTNIAIVFDDIEKRLLEEEKFNEEVETIISINRLSFIIFSILPLVFVIYVLILNKDYIDILISPIGIAVMLILIILYVLYVLILYRVSKGEYGNV